MRKKLLSILALLCLMVTSAWAQTGEQVFYTLDGTQTGGTSAYASESEITQGDIKWMVTGNTTQNPWRIGGKNLTNVDRPLYSTSTLNKTITKVEVVVGTATATFNSLTLIVASDAEFKNVIDTKTPESVAPSTTFTFTPSTDKEWKDAYYKIIFNVSADGSNRYVQFVSAKFYYDANAGGGEDIVDGGTCGDPNVNEGKNVTWKLTGTKGNYTLTISGTGDIFYEVRPWNDYKEDITSVVIGEGVTSLPEVAFDGFSSLPSIAIPASVTSIGKLAFQDCTSLTTITVEDGNANFKAVDGVLMSADGKKLYVYPMAKTATSYTVPNGVTSIEQIAFCGCTSLTSVSFPTSLEAIGPSAFGNCSGLKSIDLAENLKLTTISGGAFSHCSSLASVSFPANLETIDESAFFGCASLASVSLPASMETIGELAFYGCTTLASVTILAPSLTTYGYGAFGETAAGLIIYVPAASVETYKAAWSTYTILGIAEEIGYEVEVPAGEYITYYKDEALKVEDEEIALYTVTAVGEETATLTQLNVAPALTPLLVYNGSTKPKTIRLVPTEDEADEVEAFDGFKGTLEGETLEALVGCDKYAFNGKQFVWVNKALEVEANKCWLEVVTGTPPAARALALVIGKTSDNNEDSFTITFQDNGTGSDGSSAKTEIKDLVAEGADYLESIEANKVYNARKDRGIKLGTSTVNGSITLNLKETVKATKIVTTARKYNDTQHELTVNGEVFDLGTGNDFADYELTYTTPTEISSITIEATKCRAYVTAVTVYYQLTAAGGGSGTPEEEFDLTTGISENGTITFLVDDKPVEKAKEGDVVTVEITSDKGYVPAEVSGLWYAAVAAARGSQSVDLLTDIELTPVEGTYNKWTFTMQRANAEISATYWDISDVIEQLRQETELSKMLFKTFGDKTDVELLKEMLKTIGAAVRLLNMYDNGETVSSTEAYDLLNALKAINAQFDDVLTKIENVDVNQNEKVFDLQGRRVAQPTKGLYIVNGKKVVIK